jgi:hypothetical protein
MGQAARQGGGECLVLDGAVRQAVREVDNKRRYRHGRRGLERAAERKDAIVPLKHDAYFLPPPLAPLEGRAAGRADGDFAVLPRVERRAIDQIVGGLLGRVAVDTGQVRAVEGLVLVLRERLLREPPPLLALVAGDPAQQGHERRSLGALALPLDEARGSLPGLARRRPCTVHSTRPARVRILHLRYKHGTLFVRCIITNAFFVFIPRVGRR